MSSIEQIIAANTAALEANTAALLGAGGAAKTTAAKTTAAKTTAAKGPKNSVDKTHALVTKIGTEFGKEAARKVLKDAAGLTKLAEVTDANTDAVFEAATEAYAELQAGADDSDDDI